jgi:hypothetical protein
VRRELANLVSIGIVSSNGENNKVYYEVSTSWRFYDQLRTIFASSDSKANDLKVNTKAWSKKLANFGGLRVVIFAGKLVYGSDSKIDLLVVGDGIGGLKFRNLVKALEKDAGVSLLYTQLSFNDFYYRLSIRDAFVMNVLRAKNEVVYDPENLISKSDKIKKEGE